MFKSRRKKQQKEAAAIQRQQQQNEAAAKTEIESSTVSKIKLLDDIHLANDFRSSIILPQLNKDLDPSKLSRQQLHLAQLRDIPESPSSVLSFQLPPSSPIETDGSKQYQDLAAWKKLKSQNRYSNGLFGGKQRGRPTPNQISKRLKECDLKEEIEDEEQQEEAVVSVENSSTIEQSEKTPIMILTRAEPIMQHLQIDDDEEKEEVEEEEEEEEEGFLLQEEYEPESDTEENFFFQDFSSNSNNNSKKKKTSRRHRRTSTTKDMSQFDLSSFAQDLHDQRLSVIQPRESKIIMTEDDELQLAMLLERQRVRMSMMTVTGSAESLVPPPPMPSLDLIKPHQQQTKEEPPQPVMHSDHGSTSTTTNSIGSNYSADEFSSTWIKKTSLPEKEIKIDTLSVVPESITNTAATAAAAAAAAAETIKPRRSQSSDSTTSTSQDPLKRSISTTSIKSINTIVRKRSNLRPIKDVEEIRKSVSMDHIKLVNENEPSVTSAALDWINEDHTKFSDDPTSFIYKQQNHFITTTTTTTTTPPAQPTKSSSTRRLFGSLRQVSRSKTTTHQSSGIKGLVRNFSQKTSSSSSLNNINVADSGMSRAAMAVIQHDVSKNEAVVESTVAVAASEENKGRLIGQLLARAVSHTTRKHTKIVNMESITKEQQQRHKRAQVVRKTIIYVQPDSLHGLLKKGGEGVKVVPTLPTTKVQQQHTVRNTMASDISLDDNETIRTSREYVTATKVIRQTSVRKRVVETQVTPNMSRWQCVEDEDDLIDSKHSSTISSHSNYLEGVELREMSDGSVVWGIVKKQGNRKSFFAVPPIHYNEEQQPLPTKPPPQLLGTTPPPIPKRSPRRVPVTTTTTTTATKTDIYYSNQMTLPNLLQMMQHHPGDDGFYEAEEEEEEDDCINQRAMSSVDDQLDEMMRMLQQQR